MEKIKRILSLILIAGLVLMPLIKVDAASFSASTSKTTVAPGESFTITLNATGLTGRFDISGNNCTVSPSKIWVEKGVPDSKITVTAGGEGTAKVTITAQNVADSNRNDVTGATGVNVTVKSSQTSGGNTGNNESSNNNNGGGSSTSGNNGGNTTTSSTAELKMITTSPVDFKGFKSASSGPYKVTVENNVTSIDVSTTKKESGQKVSISGNKNLDVGTNKVTVTVTSADGKNTKSYIIYVTRKSGDSETPAETPPNQIDDEEKEKLGLSAIILDEGYLLSPEFNTEIYEYTVELNEDLEELEINTIPTKQDAKIEITGNKGLVEGENVITIKVTSADGKETVEYKVKVIKNLAKTVSVPVVTKTSPTPINFDSYNQINNYSIAVITLIVIITLTGIIAMILEYSNTRLALDEGEFGGYNSYEPLNNATKDNFNYGSTFIDEEQTSKRSRKKGKHS